MMTLTLMGQAGLALGDGISQETMIGWFILAALTVSGLAVNIVTLLRTNKSQSRDVVITDKYVTSAVCHESHIAISQRLDRTESSLADVWTTMRIEDESIRVEVRKCFQDIERSLGRIEGQLEKRD